MWESGARQRGEGRDKGERGKMEEWEMWRERGEREEREARWERDGKRGREEREIGDRVRERWVWKRREKRESIGG